MAEYIEREAAILAVWEEQEAAYHRLIGGISVAVFSVDVKKRINAIPAADVAPVRHGKDIYDTVVKYHCDFKCSLCGEEILEYWGNEFNYCPYCGAKMDKEDTNG